MILTYKGRIQSPSVWTSGGEASALQNTIAQTLMSKGISVRSVTVFNPDTILSIANFRITYDIELEIISPQNENPYRVLNLLTAIFSEMSLSPTLRYVTAQEKISTATNEVLLYGGLALGAMILLTVLIKR